MVVSTPTRAVQRAWRLALWLHRPLFCCSRSLLETVRRLPPRMRRTSTAAVVVGLRASCSHTVNCSRAHLLSCSAVRPTCCSRPRSLPGRALPAPTPPPRNSGMLYDRDCWVAGMVAQQIQPARVGVTENSVRGRSYGWEDEGGL